MEQQLQGFYDELDANVGFGMTLTRDADVSGAVVAEVEPLSTAARAGVVKGDVIIKVNRMPVTDPVAAHRLLAAVAAGSVAFLLVSRNGTTIFLQVPRN